MMSSSTSGSDPFSSAESRIISIASVATLRNSFEHFVPQAGRTNRQHDTGASSGGDKRTTEYVTRDVDEETAEPRRLAWEMTI